MTEKMFLSMLKGFAFTKPLTITGIFKPIYFFSNSLTKSDTFRCYASFKNFINSSSFLYFLIVLIRYKISAIPTAPMMDPMSIQSDCLYQQQFPINNNIVFQMSQAFRKSSDLQGVSDKTDLTPPTRVDDQRNSRRAQQITHLHQQFQDLKKKIKEVQNKNEKIIEKIHKAYNFKKKNAYTEEYIPTGEGSPVVYYENRYEPGYSGAMSVDAHSNKSDHSQKQFKLQKRSTDLASKKAMKNKNFNYSMQYGKTEANIADQEDGRHNQMQMRYTGGQFPPNYPPNQSISAVGSQNRLQRKLVQELSQEKLTLQQELSQRESQIYRLQAIVKNNSRNIKGTIESTLEEFYENVLQKNLTAIEKAFKKYQQKLKNVKKIALLAKDKQQERKSSRLLQYGRARRSQSRSRRNSPPRDSVKQSKILNYSRNEIKDESRSRSKIGAAEQQEKNKEFQQIANKYEQLIKSKTQEIEKWDKKYRLKERECYQLKMRVDVLQKRLTEQEKRLSRGQSMTSEPQVPQKSGKKMSTESNLLADIDEPDVSAYENEIAKLQSKIQQLQSISNQKSTQISNLQNTLSTIQNKNKSLYSEHQDNLNKIKHKYQQQQQKFKRQFDKIINQKNDECLNYKNLLMANEKKYLEKECEYFSLESKIKKIQGMVSSKDKKIQELQKLLGDNCPTDRSMMMSSLVGASSDNTQAIKKLKQQIESLENRLETNKNQIFSLTKKNAFYKNKAQQFEHTTTQMKKQIESLHIENEQLKINVNMNNISAVMKGGEQEDISREEDEIVGQSLSVIDDNAKKFNVDFEAVNQKLAELTREKQQWYQKYQKIKNQNLEKQSEAIRTKSQLGFIKKQLEDAEALANKLKTQNENLKNDNKELQSKLLFLQQEFQTEREQFKAQISDIEKRWIQFEQDIRKSGFQGQGERSERSSVVSYTNTNRNQMDYVNTQNQLLTVKLKQAEAQIQAQKAMEQKIIQEYQVVMEEYKIQIKNKGDHIKSLKEQIEDLNTKIHNLTVRLEIANKNQNLNTSSNARKDQKNQLLERIQELEAEVKETKEINSKLTDMEGQLFDQIKIKEEERGQLYEELRKKDLRIQELQEILEVRTNQQGNAYGSHMSQSTHKRESIKSQSSLKYSSHSQVLRKSRMLASKGGNASDERIFDLELSDAGSEFFEQPSQISNISEFFEKEQLPYEKIKIKRQEQIKLFEKTASYIKSLKKAIEEKNKKIKLLEKKIQSLKSSELVRKELGLDIDIKEDRLTANDRLQADDTFKDYESVQLEYKRGGHLRRYKQLQHDTKLVMEENNLLIQQIQTLEQELLKAEEQENSLVKIKDLYKEQIKKLIKKNEEQTKSFEQELKNERKRVEESESVHNIEAIKQLFTKIVQIAGLKFTQEMGTKKKEQKRKELEQYVKVMSNILKLDKKAKEVLMLAIQK